ncbi:energy-coupling factor transport system ATP-binding protein [Lacrimispora xylanisolvens]|uniref:Energy-coupling factor transporter ATP-binding protein EcfA2 n=2 Tax=Lacrimispora xylanisolvens TaxID=384636 RepID=A0A2S6HMZ3_9FIRM|nr:energy-coupling factor transporter ATPase [Hungatella xylanolytica]PPK78866.1 energy-coupling factor transport system ATP-binding protein [Hungatella xylanolytica]
MPIIKTEHLNYEYSSGSVFHKTAISDINIEIEQGEFVALIGHTGSGKSTLIKHLNGLLKPTSGKVFIEGQDIWSDPKNLRKYRFMVGMVFQYPEYQLFEETVYKDIAYGPMNIGIPESEINERVMKSISFVGLDKTILSKSPFDLSGGEKRRAAIAGVVAMNPKVLILDEPTAGLDPLGRDRILREINEYHRNNNVSIILVSHNMEDVANYADKILVMNDTKIVLNGSVSDVYCHAKKLKEIGLSIPQIMEICLGLNERGIPIDPLTTSVEDAVHQIIDLFKLKEKDGQKC